MSWPDVVSGGTRNVLTLTIEFDSSARVLRSMGATSPIEAAAVIRSYLNRALQAFMVEHGLREGAYASEDLDWLWRVNNTS